MRAAFVRLLAGFLLAVLAGIPPAASQERRGEPGAFDYWILSLSWSPAFCAGPGGADSPEQCGVGRRYGFIVHGLWPQWQTGGWPQYCARAGEVPAGVTEAMLPIMPSRDLIAHQWRKHGVCSGLDAAGYFAATRQAFEGLRIPDALRPSERPRRLSAAEIEALFAAANPGLEPDRIALVCRRRELAEIRLCLDGDFAFRSCGRGVEDRCPKDGILLRPVR